jgi:hypothetical protein
VVIPSLSQLVRVLVYQRLNLPKLGRPKSRAVVKPDRIQPKLRTAIIPFHVNMPWLLPIRRIEEKPVGTGPEDGWHRRKSTRGKRRVASIPGCWLATLRF